MWLHRVLDAAHGIFSCGMWKLVPQPGVKPRAPCIWSHQGSPLSPLLMGSHGRSLWSVSQAAQLLGQSPALHIWAPTATPESHHTWLLAQQGRAQGGTELTHLSWSGSPG